VRIAVHKRFSIAYEAFMLMVIINKNFALS